MLPYQRAWRSNPGRQTCARASAALLCTLIRSRTLIRLNELPEEPQQYNPKRASNWSLEESCITIIHLRGMRGDHYRSGEISYTYTPETGASRLPPCTRSGMSVGCYVRCYDCRLPVCILLRRGAASSASSCECADIIVPARMCLDDPQRWHGTGWHPQVKASVWIANTRLFSRTCDTRAAGLSAGRREGGQSSDTRLPG